jgi:hypothetical protein
LRKEFAEEQRAGFPRLKRVPDTHVIRFLDHFAGLNPVEQSELTAILADWSSYKLLGTTPIPTPTVERFTRATTYVALAEGLRYTGVQLLAGLAKGALHGGLDGWFRLKGISGLALQPPDNLLPNPTDLAPVRIPTLRRLVGSAFATLFATNVAEVGDGIWRYDGTLAESLLKVLIRYSGKMGQPQLKYQVEVGGNGRLIAGPDICFESVLGVGFGRWDYITRENAERSVDLLCELVEYMARLPGRLPA